jgi:predicted acylesterase/phospholipase RssA
VDEDLGSVTIDETAVRFVAVTTALLKKEPPETRIVTEGTLGAAAQASGAAPLLFAPTEIGGERFADGASAALIPVRILKDCGADFVFAFNCLPGPPRRNPFDRTLIGRTLYDCTSVGRVIDLWVSAGSMMQRMSREACEDAHVYFEPSQDEWFLVESVLFARARSIAQKWRDVQLVVGDCVKTWERVRRGGAPGGRAPAARKARTSSAPRSVGARRRGRAAPGAAKGRKRAK